MSTGNLNKNSLSAKKNIRFEHDLIEAIEQAKDPLIPFSAWVKQACKDKLEREKSGTVAPVITSKLRGAQTTIINSDAPLNAKNNRDEIQAMAFELKEKGNTYQQIADHFNGLGYLTGMMKPFRRDSVTSLLRYTDNLKKKGIKL